MRPTLTWEEHGGSRSLAAVYERGALILAMVLPVPMLAAAGLSLPLPQSIFRLGILAAERTALIADALPGVGRDRPAKTATPVLRDRGHVAHAAVRRAAPVQAATTAPAPHRSTAAHGSRRHATGTPAHLVVKSKPTTGSTFAGRGQTDPTTDPVTTTPAPTTGTPSTPSQPATPTKATDTGATAVTPAPAASPSDTARTDKPTTSPADQQPVQDGSPTPGTITPVTTTPVTITPVTITPVTTTPVTTTPTPARGQGQGRGDSSGTTTTTPGQSNKGSGSSSGSGGGSNSGSGQGDKKNATTTTAPATR